MKIAYLGTRGIPARYGGFETCVEEVATRLARRGHHITVFCGFVDCKPDFDSYKGVRLTHIPCLKNKFLDFPFRALSSTLGILDKKFDIAHFYGSDAWPFSLFSRLMSVKTVLSLDGLVWNRKSYPIWVRKILRLTTGFALYIPNATTVDSKFVQNWYRQNYNKAPIFVPYGANINSEDLDESILNKRGLRKEKYILFVGRLVYEKAVHHLISAFKGIKTDYKLVIIGSDPYQKKYESFLRKIANKNTLFLGNIYGKEYEHLCKGAYIYVTPSELEGTSPALLTAMAMGKCVLVSDIPENLESIGKAGFSFKHGDPLDLKEKLQFLIENPDNVKKIKFKAINRIKDLYNWNKIVDQIEKIYLSLNH
jgi:glycosyltransferase involved in cell wall biosynthesis